jgi:hypothetical protein
LRAMPGAAQHDGTMRPQSADASKFYFREAHFLLPIDGQNARDYFRSRLGKATKV